jgi:hypothetical protein
MHFTLPLYYISIDPYICFGLCKNHHQGVQNYIHLHPMVFLSLLLCNILVFNCRSLIKSVLNQSFLKNIYRCTKYKIVENSCRKGKMLQYGSLCYIWVLFVLGFVCPTVVCCLFHVVVCTVQYWTVLQHFTILHFTFSTRILTNSQRFYTWCFYIYIFFFLNSDLKLIL